MAAAAALVKAEVRVEVKAAVKGRNALAVVAFKSFLHSLNNSNSTTTISVRILAEAVQAARDAVRGPSAPAVVVCKCNKCNKCSSRSAQAHRVLAEVEEIVLEVEVEANNVLPAKVVKAAVAFSFLSQCHSNPNRNRNNVVDLAWLGLVAAAVAAEDGGEGGEDSEAAAAAVAQEGRSAMANVAS